MDRRVLIGFAVVIVVLVSAIGVLYVFGTPQAPQVAYQQYADGATGSGAGAADPAPLQPDAARVAPADAGETSDPMAGGAKVDPNAKPPQADPNSPLAIEIPGCVCHSDDPKLVKQHAEYRMNQCAGCHLDGTPTGQ
jgi:hypothetical protein